MYDKDSKITDEEHNHSSCSCAQTVKGHNCPCKKRICIPIMAIAGIAVAVSLAAKTRSRK